MMSGVSLETYWAINRHLNNKFYYTVASCCLFLYDLYYDPWTSSRILIHDQVILLVTLHEEQRVFLGPRVSIHALVQASSVVASVYSYVRNVFPPSKVIVSWQRFVVMTLWECNMSEMARRVCKWPNGRPRWGSHQPNTLNTKECHCSTSGVYDFGHFETGGMPFPQKSKFKMAFAGRMRKRELHSTVIELLNYCQCDANSLTL